ncbi:MAG: hypothetical protein U0L58_11055, partial [Ruminococcus sp.]|nr:hypothetical protein [Ruminococcus sp.]
EAIVAVATESVIRAAVAMLMILVLIDFFILISPLIFLLFSFLLFVCFCLFDCCFLYFLRIPQLSTRFAVVHLST